MSTKITKTQLEKLIKEETEKVLSEAASFSSSGMKEAEVAQWAQDNWKTFGSEMRKLQKEFTSFEFAGKIVSKHMKARVQRIAWRDTNIDNPDLAELQKSWQTCVRKLFPSPQFARSLLVSCVRDFKSREPNSDSAAFVRGRSVKLSAFMTGFQDAAELLDSKFDDLDRFDGAVGRGSVIGYTKAVNELMTEALKKIRPIFWEWVNGTLGGDPTPAPAPAPNKKDCEKAKKLIAMLDDPRVTPELATDPAALIALMQNPTSTAVASAGPILREQLTPDQKKLAISTIATLYNCPDAAGGITKPPKKSSGTCGKFNKFAAQVTGQKDVKEAVKMIQEILVNLGYSVKRGETDSGFGPGKGMIPSTKLKSAGIDGRCGRGTMDAVKRFQGANKLSVDGIVGPNTYKVLVSVAKGGDNKKATANAGNIGQDNIRSVRIYKEFWNRLSAQRNSTDLMKYLPRLISAQSEYNIGGKTVSAQNIGVVAMGMIDKFLQDDAAFEALKLDTDKVNLELERVKNIIKRSPPANESKSYNLDFDKWSKLWK